jgi:hypothetical protein
MTTKLTKLTIEQGMSAVAAVPRDARNGARLPATDPELFRVFSFLSWFSRFHFGFVVLLFQQP